MRYHMRTEVLQFLIHIGSLEPSLFLYSPFFYLLFLVQVGVKSAELQFNNKIQWLSHFKTAAKLQFAREIQRLSNFKSAGKLQESTGKLHLLIKSLIIASNPSVTWVVDFVRPQTCHCEE